MQGSAPSTEAIDAARAAASTALATLPEEIRNAAAILLGNELGVAMIPAGGAAPESLAKEAFALDAAASAGPHGTCTLVGGKLFQVVAAKVRGGALLGAAWALDDSFAAAQSHETTLGVTLAAGDVLVSSLKGPERVASARAHNGPLAVGSFASLGPISLPLFAGKAARFETRSFPLEGVEGGRVVLTAESNGMVALAEMQQKMLLAIGGLILLAIAFMLLMGSTTEVVFRSGSTNVPNPEPHPSIPSEPAVVLGAAPAAPEPAVTPDDFPFGDSAPAQPQPEAAQQPLAPAPEPEPAAVPQPEPAQAFAAQPAEVLAQAAIPMPGPAAFAPPAPAAPEQPFDPFAAAAAQMPEEEPSTNHEATVVSAVPEELLRAATRARPSAPITTPIATPAVDAIPLPSPTPAAAPAVDPEEAHFLEVFNQFIATRAQCNEPADGLTAEKFVAKLRRNREQLIQKYNCRSVRFQVYVKDGKAALKATPIKD